VFSSRRCRCLRAAWPWPETIRQRADIDGDGLVSPGEAITFKELLGILTPEDPVLAQIVIAYGYAMDKGGVSPVDLTLLLEKAVTGAEAEEFALAALPPPCPCMAFTRGDANNSNTVDIADEIYILSFLFQSGSAPVPLDSGDANDDGMIDVADAIYISSYLFSQVEPKPPLPFGPHRCAQRLVRSASRELRGVRAGRCAHRYVRGWQGRCSVGDTRWRHVVRI